MIPLEKPAPEGYPSVIAEPCTQGPARLVQVGERSNGGTATAPERSNPETDGN